MKFLIARLVFVILFTIGLVFNSYSTMSWVSVYDTNNIRIMHNTNGWDVKFNYDLDIFINLCLQLENKFYNKNNLPNIIFDLHLYSNYEEEQYGISYGKMDYDSWVMTKSGKKRRGPKTGIIIRVFGSQFDFKSALKLMDFGINNLDYLKNNLVKQKFEDDYRDFTGIPFDKVNSIIKSSNSKVDEVVKEKTFGFFPKVDFHKHALLHYYQNDSIHFFINDPHDKPVKINDILTIKHAYEIKEFISNYNNDYYIIFDSDSIFYCINYRDETSSKKFVIKNTALRTPLTSSYFVVEHDLIVFSFVPHDNDTFIQTIGFFPKKNLLIPNYLSLENKFINELQNPKKSKKEETLNRFEIWFFISLIFIVIQFLILIILMRKRKSNRII